MNKKYFNDSISDEVLATLIDDTLRFKKTAKSRSIRTHLLKIVPAVAVIVITIGLMNMLPMLNFGFGEVRDPYTVPPLIITDEVSGEELTAVPLVIESETFDSLIALVSNTRVERLFRAYYQFRDGDTPHFILAPNISDRELALLLENWNTYIGWTDESYNNMLEEFGLAGDKEEVNNRFIRNREVEIERREAQEAEMARHREERAYLEAQWAEQNRARAEVLSDVKMAAVGSDEYFVQRTDGELWGRR